jgi:Phage-related lysozyme (muraminidase)
MATYDKPAFERMMTFEEGNRLKPYLDTKGKLTIGIGRNLTDVGIRGGESLLLFWNDVAEVERILDKNIPWWREMTPNRQMAIMSMCFQMGWDISSDGGLDSFGKMLAALRLGDYREAKVQALDSKWARDDSPERAQRMATLIERG